MARVVVPITNARPAPPDDLTKDQAVEWERIVRRLPGDWFTAEKYPLLVALCRHIVLARSIAATINEFKTAWVAEEGSLERLTGWRRWQLVRARRWRRWRRN